MRNFESSVEVPLTSRNVHAGLFITTISPFDYCGRQYLWAQTSAGGYIVPGMDFVWNLGNGVSFGVYPSPATDLVTITTTSDSPFEVQLWNDNHMVRQGVGRDRSAQLSVSGLPSGLYYVVVMKEGKTYRQKLIVK